ncbi:hypothetical protein DB347_23460 [Opitutaceae bacterium EW11]|nr:hypothetical protein DB347_23460 [Opitutaceae bacterium EW11]
MPIEQAGATVTPASGDESRTPQAPVRRVSTEANALTSAARWLVLPLVLVCAAAAWNPRGDFWGGVEPPKAQCEAYDSARLRVATVLDTSVYDSGKLKRVIREPQNTVSNLAYVAVGVAVLFAARRRMSRAFGTACVFLGIGSGFYHVSLLPQWRMLDILGVYAVLFCLIGVGVAALGRWKKKDGMVAIACWGVAFWTGIHRNDIRIHGFKLLDSKHVVIASVAIGFACAALCFFRVKNRRRYWARLAVLAPTAALAFFGGSADRYGGAWAAPDALIQGHTVWHVAGAIALLAAYEVFSMTGYDRSVFAIDSAEQGDPPRDP